MTTLARQRCLQHPDREAVARCLECSRYYCRECVTDHEGRLICAACLLKEAQPAVPKRHRGRFLGGVARVAGVAAGILVAWGCFYLVGRTLVRIPSSFHEAALWERLMAPLERGSE